MGRAPSPAIRPNPGTASSSAAEPSLRDRVEKVEQLRDFYLEITGAREPVEWPEGVPA